MATPWFMVKTIGKRIKWLVLWLALIVGGIGTGCLQTSAGVHPMARDGLLDLGKWDFNENGYAALNGEWSFYWNQLLSPRDFEQESQPQRTGVVPLPGLWKGTVVNNHSLAATGFATYRLKVRLDHLPEQMALYLGNPLSVCRIWLNGNLAAQSGRIGQTRETEHPEEHSMITHFKGGNTDLDIILQISNHHNMQGGMRTPILLGTEGQIHWYINKHMIITAVLSGAIFVLSLYHLGLYLYRRSDSATLWFGLYCLMTAISTSFGDRETCLAATFFTNLPWRLSIDLSLLPHGLTVPLLVMIYHVLFPYQYGRRVERFYQIIGALFIFYILGTPPNAFDPVLFMYRLASLTVIPYLLFRFVIDFRQKAEGISYLLPGYLFLSIATVNDFLFDGGLINTALLGQYASILLAVSYSFLISTRLSRAFASVKALSSELDRNMTRLRSYEKKLLCKNNLSQTLEKHMPVDPPTPDKRGLGVRVMNLAVDLWVITTKTTKVEMADRSKLWSVYFEKDGFARTQTLDKYLSEKTLPSRPRWKTIINTADFVLEECKGSSRLKTQLVESLKMLKQMT